MAGNGRVFISHVHEDNARVAPLLAALDAWGVDYWFDTQQLGAGQHISERVQQALAQRDIFVLICTPATNASLWTSLELQAFRGLLERDRQSGRGEQRRVVYLILDPAYERQPVGQHDIVVDASQAPPCRLVQRSAPGARRQATSQGAEPSRGDRGGRDRHGGAGGQRVRRLPAVERAGKWQVPT